MAVLGGGGSLARLSHSTQKEIKVGDTVVVVFTEALVLSLKEA